MEGAVSLLSLPEGMQIEHIQATSTCISVIDNIDTRIKHAV